jgi:hypothetical protein
MMLPDLALAWAARHERRIVLALCALVFLAGTAIALARGDSLPYVDEHDYYAIATSVAGGHGFNLEGRPTAWRPPAYPLLLAVPTALGAGIPQLRILNAGLLALAIYFTHALVRTAAPPPAGLVAAILAAGYPVLLYASGTLFPQTLGALLLVVVVLLLARHPGTWGLLGTGLLFGMLILTIPTFIFQLGLIAGWLLWARREPPQRVALMVAPALGLVGLWALRNYLALGSFVFVTTNAGLPLLVGNYPGALPDADPAIYLADLAPQLSRAETMSEVQADHYFRDQALAYITGQPADALRLYALKVLNYFNYRSEIHAAGETTLLRDLVMALTYLPLLALLALRLLLTHVIRLSPLEGLLALLYLSNALIAALFFTKIRYRLPFDLLLIAIAALAVFQIVSLGRARRRLQPMGMRPAAEVLPDEAELGGTGDRRLR